MKQLSQLLPDSESGERAQGIQRRPFLKKAVGGALAMLLSGCGSALHGVLKDDVLKDTGLKDIRDGAPLSAEEMERILQEFEAQKARIAPKGKEEEEFVACVVGELRHDGWEITDNLKTKIATFMEVKFPGVRIQVDGKEYFSFIAGQPVVFSISLSQAQGDVIIRYANLITGVCFHRSLRMAEDGTIRKSFYKKDFSDPQKVRLDGVDTDDNQESYSYEFRRNDPGWQALNHCIEEKCEQVIWNNGRRGIAVYRHDGKITTISETDKERTQGDFHEWTLE